VHLEWTEDCALEDGHRSPANALTLRIQVLFFSGSALRRRLAIRARSTGAKVSGRKKGPTSVQEPAKIIITQKTQCQLGKLVVPLQGWVCQQAARQTDGRTGKKLTNRLQRAREQDPGIRTRQTRSWRFPGSKSPTCCR
jgi:hypothetical protein